MDLFIMGNDLTGWQCVASRLIRAELQKRGIKYSELSKLLKEIGLTQTPSTLRSKVHKGNFGAALLLAIFHVIKADINPIELSVILAGCADKEPGDEMNL
jgi:hypothetical protein